MQHVRNVLWSISESSNSKQLTCQNVSVCKYYLGKIQCRNLLRQEQPLRWHPQQVQPDLFQMAAQVQIATFSDPRLKFQLLSNILSHFFLQQR